MNHDDIVAEIGRLSETTATLKKKLEEPKSKLDRFKEYAGIISLVLSVATGFFAVYTALWVEPQKSKADEQAKLHEKLAEIVSLDQEYLRAVQTGDPNANNGTLESKRNILLQQGEELSEGRDVASFEDQINLGNAYEFGRRYDLAVRHFKAALTLAGSDALKKATAETRLAKLDFFGVSGATSQEGRRLFEDAENLLRSLSSSDASLALAQSLSIRSWIECSVGDPALGLEAKRKASAIIDRVARDPAVSPQLVDAFRVGLSTGLGNTHCVQSGVIPQADATGTQVLAHSQSKIDLSNHIMDLLIHHKYAAIESQMNATVKSQVPLERLQLFWDGLTPQVGSYRRIISTESTSFNNIPIYVVHGEFQKARVDLRLAFDGTNQISYFLVTPLSVLPRQEIQRMAGEVATDFFKQQFSAVVAKFDSTLETQLPENKLREIWSQATSDKGNFEREVSSLKNRDLDLVDVLCQMQGGRLVVRVAYDPDMKINAFVVASAK